MGVGPAERHHGPVPASPFAVLDRTVPRRIIFGLLLLAAFGAMAYVAIDPGPTTRTASDRDPAIEALIPTANADVLRQSEVGIDLAEGYRASLTINDVPIPPDQIIGSADASSPPSLARYVFAPGDGKAVETLRAGLNCVTAEFWLATDPNDTSVYNWCFSAA